MYACNPGKLQCIASSVFELFSALQTRHFGAQNISTPCVRHKTCTDAQSAASALQGALDDADDSDPLLAHSLPSNNAVLPDDEDLAALADTPTEALEQEFTQATTLASVHPQAPPRPHASGARGAISRSSPAAAAAASRTAQQAEDSIVYPHDKDWVGPGEGRRSTEARDETSKVRTPDSVETMGLQDILEPQGSTGRKYEEILRWFPKRVTMDREVERQDAIMRRLSFQAHDMLSLPRQFSGALHASYACVPESLWLVSGLEHTCRLHCGSAAWLLSHVVDSNEMFASPLMRPRELYFLVQIRSACTRV